jgi:hypothetical protein
MQMRETSTSEGGNYSLPPILPSEPQFPKNSRKAGTWDILFYFPSEGGFFGCPKKSNGFGRELGFQWPVC